VHALENSVIRLCEGYGVEAFRTRDTGVWCNTPEGERKIASIGIHLRRNITSHGVGINVTNEVFEYFDRIDACGLGKGVTSLESMGVNATREQVEGRWTGLFAEELEREVRTLKDVSELEDSWGLENGEILDIMFRGDMQAHYDPDYI
jgi:lipoyl(octanoyl) transferase 2